MRSPGYGCNLEEPWERRMQPAASRILGPLGHPQCVLGPIIPSARTDLVVFDVLCCIVSGRRAVKEGSLLSAPLAVTNNKPNRVAQCQCCLVFSRPCRRRQVVGCHDDENKDMSNTGWQRGVTSRPDSGVEIDAKSLSACCCSRRAQGDPDVTVTCKMDGGLEVSDNGARWKHCAQGNLP
ncbi:hypothetical protein N658DRAFT_127477 [Parathielavia hyrcaniae]|uniref:Uncharacterized protein n=1 Tax=Parathielavia hyrcaniae TaxID=113614 RepID=A0AAN6Q8M7_9PEZI|nr:hypothetical protein N658DRAFT_127477 [Parathielavia hyrcaniae]